MEKQRQLAEAKRRQDEAEQKKRKDEERALAGFMQETYRLQARVLNKKANIDSLSCDRGQTFGKYLDALKENLTVGELAMKNNDVHSANSSFKNAEAAADWIIKNVPLRRQVQQLQKQVVEQKEKADKFNSSRLAYVAYHDAENLASSGNRDYESGKFASAENSLRSAVFGYEKAYSEARKLTVDDLISSARVAGNSQDWERMLKQAEAALEIDSGNTEAQQLITEAEKHLKPTLNIIATVDGVRVPAKIKFGNTELDTMKTLRNFRENANYKASLSYRSSADEYVGKIRFNCNWRGPKKMTVALEKVEFNGIVTLAKGVKLDMVKVEPGTFPMGKRDGENESDEVEHQKTLTKAFFIGTTEVTNEQWCAVMKVSTPPSLKNKWNKYPVENVSWYKAMQFCEKMNKYAPKGWQFTLPTEAQWEFAARGGNKSKGYKYSGSNDLGKVGWYSGNSGSTTHKVRSKSPNELGLYDMSGNVWEWCLDNRNSDASKNNAEFTRAYSDRDGSHRVYRGGSWSNNARHCRSANRSGWGPGYRANGLGFRLALVPVQ